MQTFIYFKNYILDEKQWKTPIGKKLSFLYLKDIYLDGISCASLAYMDKESSFHTPHDYNCETKRNAYFILFYYIFNIIILN